ncbi:guanylate kinase [Powellomyces hirtus]|uniref:Guanylate kinase n=1 Tax=Powellomyces hirtus TaxID=109895 RepID=A0A507ECA7_9FUNG|nr:guanylate kinase [Powellomyces hirtus]
MSLPLRAAQTTTRALFARASISTPSSCFSPLIRYYASAPSPVFASKSADTRSNAKRVLAAVGVLTVGGLGGYRLYSFRSSNPSSSSSSSSSTPANSNETPQNTAPVKPATKPSTPPSPRAIVMCGPSGSGKSTLLKRLLAEHPTAFGFSVSHTTRTPRTGERDGTDYHFITRPQFASAVANNEFIEHATFAKNDYGTSYKAVDDVLAQNKHVVLDIDMQGVLQLQTALKNGAKKFNGGRPLFVFVAPPSMSDLEKRLVGRGTENKETLEQRLLAAKDELKWGLGKGNVDVVIVNDDVEKAYGELKSAIFH